MGYSVVRFAVETGCRLSEVRGAPKSGIDREEMTFRVSQRADENGVIDVPKSYSGRREIDIPEDLLSVIDRAAALTASDLLFPAESGRPFAASNFYKRYWIPLLIACGLA
jgi:hypothetical protein